MKIDKKMTIAEAMKVSPAVGKKLAERNLFCGGCPFAQMETIEGGAEVHGIDADELVEELNKELK